ncbi:LysR family transcriptional regulator [Herbaspirillum sp. YR522]|uniref:LysR family transcriptional regulator n=1 Tax=Herbaspirillum sp. YR522 TaxID=1144342 RepID=UPI00026F90AE|nr:LysR family transcriptional regulator [Herbaspirillum sp. YR522]EJN09850.1 transcriptional regulator [Herbaspirillum sp. YR522]
MNNENARLRRLLLFDAVCHEGGISQAAEAVGLTQPAVSLAIKKLEEAFGAVLFERGFGGSDLTRDGQLLHRRVQRMRQQIEAAVSQALSGTRSRATDVQTVCRHLTDAQIRCHIAIAELGSAAEAARRLAISQPAVHRAARSLEDNLGVTLYRRRVHSVSANGVGLELARRLVVAQGEIEQASADLVHARGLAGGRIAVGVLPLLPQRLLARTIGRLRENHPNVAVTIREGAHSRLLEDLRFGRLDIIVGALREPRLQGSVVEIELFIDPYVVVARRGHALAARRKVAPADLVDYGWVVPQQDMPRRAVVETMLATLPERPPVVVETSSLAMMMAMLEENDCISLLSRSHILYGNYRNDVVALKVVAPNADRTVGVTMRSDWLPTQVQQDFLEQLRLQCRMDD